MQAGQQQLPFKRIIRLASGEHVVRTPVATLLPWECKVCGTGYRTKQGLLGHNISKLHLEHKALADKRLGSGLFRVERPAAVVVDVEQETILPARTGMAWDSYRELPLVQANVVTFHLFFCEKKPVEGLARDASGNKPRGT